MDDGGLVEAACEVLHDAYEKAANLTGWATNPTSRAPWGRVPPENRATMRAAVTALLAWLPDAARHTSGMSEHEHLGAPETLPGLGKATACVIGFHRPKPLRYVWHHLTPQVCGGQTIQENLVQVCDNCHLAIHALMFQLKQNGGHVGLLKRGTAKQRVYAHTGYMGAVHLGTVENIPNEGGELTAPS